MRKLRRLLQQPLSRQPSHYVAYKKSHKFYPTFYNCSAAIIMRHFCMLKDDD